jgi:hypothetical protein
MKYEFGAQMERYWEGKHEGLGEKPVPAPLFHLKFA